jgi:4-alpha-glucanotransferase
VIPFKLDVLRRSFERFKTIAGPEQRDAFEDFQTTNASWLADYALFAALKQAHGGANWNTWAPELARHEPAALAEWRREQSDQFVFQCYMQFQFYRQWLRLKAYANERNVRIIGDIPIFVAYDSADVWANRQLFSLDEARNTTVVAGVPPDYFSATGQLWGNPLYRWDILAQSGYRWWLDRFRAALTLVDFVRLDHFRGFAAYWEVPASEETAINGRWMPGPGADLFEAVGAALGRLPIIAEDLGLITPDVEELRDRFGFPGMKVLQFAFGDDADNAYLPHNYGRRCVVYTGTHDNDTTAGWWTTATPRERYQVQTYLGRDGSDISWDFIRLALASVAEMAIVPMQDVLGLGGEARMNTPGRAGGNWTWRYKPNALTQELVERLRALAALYGRVRQEQPAEEGEKADRRETWCGPEQ